MLRTTEAVRARQRRPLPSLKQQYLEYVLQRIETYKNTLGRTRLMEDVTRLMLSMIWPSSSTRMMLLCRPMIST